jgi:activator of HSP90 ATPase
MEDFEIYEVFPVKPSVLFEGWLDSKVHSDIIGSDSEIEPSVNGKFNIWDGYITGKTIELVKDKKIVQKWRTTEFPEKSQDSILELDFEEINDGTKMIIKHTNIPDGQSKDYKQGWIDYYFKPMKKYFSKGN